MRPRIPSPASFEASDPSEPAASASASAIEAETSAERSSNSILALSSSTEDSLTVQSFSAELADCGGFVSVGTVRKHLEHAYRKLGVTNRVAALARLQGCDEPGIDFRERIDRYA